jgi:hypothetical protein
MCDLCGKIGHLKFKCRLAVSGSVSRGSDFQSGGFQGYGYQGGFQGGFQVVE